MAVYFDAIDHFGHGFMRYHPPRQKQVSEKDFELYSGVIEAGYRYHDMMLGVLMAMAGPDTTVLLMSDHGFHPDHLRPAAIPMEPAGPAVEHRHYGIFALKGPGIKKDERIYGATVLDICPTLLTLFGLPVGQDMDGKPLVTAFAEPPKIETVPSWDAVPGSDGSHPPGTKLDAGEATEALKQLEALGYIQPLPEDAEKAVAETSTNCDTISLAPTPTPTSTRPPAEIFAELWRGAPDEHRYGAKFISSRARARALLPKRAPPLSSLRANRKKYAAEARDRVEKTPREIQGQKAGGSETAGADGIAPPGRARQLSPAPMLQMEAMLLLAENKPVEALEILKKLEKGGRAQPDFYAQMGRVHPASKIGTRPNGIFNKALELDSDHAHAHFGLAQVCLAQRRNFEAAGVGAHLRRPALPQSAGAFSARRRVAPARTNQAARSRRCRSAWRRIRIFCSRTAGWR